MISRLNQSFFASPAFWLLLVMLAMPLGPGMAHKSNPDHSVIVDTDGAIDDMRALSMLLAGNGIRVLGISCSQGSVAPATGYHKVQALLHRYHHEGIPVAAAQGLEENLPAWADFSAGIPWGAPASQHARENIPGAVQLVQNITTAYDDPVTLIALGSLKTYADWLKRHPNGQKHIKRIIWYNAYPLEEGFNYQVHPKSYQAIKQSGIPLEVVGNNSARFPVTPALLDTLRQNPSVYARNMLAAHNTKPVQEKIRQRHLQMWDDLVPLYLTAPMLFKTQERKGFSYATLPQSLPKEVVYQSVGQLLKSSLRTNNRVFNKFPVDTTLYKPPYARILKQTRKRYGPVEWKAISMTNEIHGHTGIYSIIGAKMGVRAMELFNIGVTNMEVTTFAGSKPPLSCFNDGIQISAGATMGQGLFAVSDSVSATPSAIFTSNTGRYHIRLKPAIVKQMKKQIQQGIKQHGLLTKAYWNYIEDLGLQYWARYNRHDMFVIKQLPGQKL